MFPVPSAPVRFPVCLPFSPSLPSSTRKCFSLPIGMTFVAKALDICSSYLTYAGAALLQ